MTNRVTEAFKVLLGTPKQTIIIKEGGAVLGSIKQYSGNAPNESFTGQVDMFNGDPVTKEAITKLAEQCVSTGIFTTSDDKYTLSLPSVGTAKEAIDRWNKDNNLDNKLLQIFIELEAFGNSFWYIGANGFQNIPIESINKALPRGKDIPLQELYDLQLTGSYNSKVIKYEEFIHFRLHLTGHEPFGSGKCLDAIATPDTSTPSLWDVRKSIRTSMKIGFEKFSFGNELWVFEGMSDENLAKLAIQIKNMSSTGNRIATACKGNIILSVPQRTQGYDAWLAGVDKEYFMALGTSVTPNTEYTTKATAEAVAASYKYKVSALRRVVKREIESLWNKVLDELGFDSYLANIKLHFGSEETEITIAELITLVSNKIVSVEEARKHLLKVAKVELTGEKLPIQESEVITKQETKESTNRYLNGLDKTISVKEKIVNILEKLEGTI